MKTITIKATREKCIIKNCKEPTNEYKECFTPELPTDNPTRCYACMSHRPCGWIRVTKNIKPTKQELLLKTLEVSA